MNPDTPEPGMGDVSAVPSSASSPTPATRTLVIAPQWIGDAVMTEPLMRRLHAQGQRLTVGALPWVAPVYRAMPAVAEVLVFPFAHGGLQWAGRRALARELQGRFDRALVLPNSIKAALLPWLARIPERWGYHGEGRWGLLTRRWPNPAKGDRPPMVAFYSALSDEPDVHADRPRLAVPADRVQAVLQALQQRLSLPQLRLGAYRLAVPGAEYGPAKRWPVERFAELIARTDGPVLLLGSAKESALCEAIAQAFERIQATHAHEPRAQCVPLAGLTSLDEAMALIAGAQAMVTNDTGLMHVAAAMDVPQVAVFGSSSPQHTPPLSDEARVIWLKQDADYQPPLACSPCFERVCPLPQAQGHMRCLRDITVDRVLAQLR